MFVRVVHRQGWDVELIDRGETRNFPNPEEALAFAQGEQPDWIEVGELVYATETVPQHHRWKTLRRRPDGTYRDSGLGWGGRTSR
jgi:hypothetical protein